MGATAKWLAAAAAIGFLGVIFLGAGVARAQDAVDMAAAKKEGTVVWYTSTPINQANKLVQLFQKQTGIKVELFRSGGSAILRRFNQEQSAGHVAADLLTTGDPAASNALAAKKMFVAFKPEGFDKIVDQAKDPNGYWIGQHLNILTIYLREDLVAAADRPKTWESLTDPKYSGKLVMTDPSFTSVQLSVVGSLSKKYGWEFYEKLAKNKIMVVQGNEQVSDNIDRGERLIAVGALDSYAAEDRKKGHKLLTLYPSDGVFVIPQPSAVVAGAPHPNAAKAFAAFMITPEAQKIFPADGGYAARSDIGPPAGSPDIKSMTVLPIDYKSIEADSADIKEHFNEIFQ
jgi:iron(III) transport system substrate-binding protein